MAQKVVLSAAVIQHGPKSGSFSRKNSTCEGQWASFGWNVEYVESCWIECSKNALLSAEMLNMLNMLNYFGSTGGQKGPNSGKIIQHIQHIQDFSRKKHFFFGKGHSIWSNIFNISAERSTFSKNELLSGEMIQHGPKSGSFSRNNSTWLKSGSFSRKKMSTCAENVSQKLSFAEIKNMLNHVGSSVWKNCASFCWNVEYVEYIEFFWVYGRPKGTK